MTSKQIRKFFLLALCGGMMLQAASGCSQAAGSLLTSVVPQLVLGLLTGFVGI